MYHLPSILTASRRIPILKSLPREFSSLLPLTDRLDTVTQVEMPKALSVHLLYDGTTVTVIYNAKKPANSDAKSENLDNNR